jgi:dihydroxyacetone kinase-like protein
MKKIINTPERFIEDLAHGMEAAYPNQIKLLDGDYRVVVRAVETPGKVGIVTAGGGGHLPVFTGYVGKGMLDGCALGNVFASPSAAKMLAMIQHADTGAGVLCLYGNYGGDIMNFEMACENADLDDIKTTQVLVTDDVASAPRENRAKRRGVAGMVFAFKCAGAAAERMASLEEVTRIAQKACDSTVTLGIALSPCIVPEVGKPSFEIAEDEMELGMGIHGEPGIETVKMKTADEIAELLTERLLADLPDPKAGELAVMVNGLGGTPLEELYIVYNRVAKLLDEKGIKHGTTPYIGEYATSMEMAGLSLTFMQMDDELKELFLAPASTPFFTNANK